MRQMGNAMLELRALKEENAVPEKLGKNWHEGFWSRHPSIGTERTQVMERMRVQGANSACLSVYLDLFKEMACSQILEDVYNMDETGVRLGINKAEHCVIDKTIKITSVRRLRMGVRNHY